MSNALPSRARCERVWGRASIMTSQRKDEGRTRSMKGFAEEYLFTKPYSIQIIKVLHVPIGLHGWGTNRKIGKGERGPKYGDAEAFKPKPFSWLKWILSEGQNVGVLRSLFIQGCMMSLDRQSVFVFFHENVRSMFPQCRENTTSKQLAKLACLSFRRTLMENSKMAG